MKLFNGVFLLIGILFFTTACQSTGNNADNEDSTLVQMHMPVSSETAMQVDSFLTSYYRLTSALVDGDPIAAINTTGDLLSRLNNISLKDIKDENQREVVNKDVEHLKELIQRMENDSSLSGIRLNFEYISKNTYQLIKRAGLKNVTVYRTFCPMAFNDKGAYWLSKTADIRNPYFGHQMINCGEVRETLQF